MAEPYRSLYSVIPASVRDDKTLRPNAKLLYGELSALTMAEGYCWASNQYLADVFDLAPKTIEALIKQLRDRGHIYVEVERDPNTNEVLRRKIWISGPPGMVVPPPLKNKGRSPQNCGDPPLKIEGENNNNINNNIPPIVPQEGDSASVTEPEPKPKRKRKKRDPDALIPKWQPERFAGFWAAYPRGNDKARAVEEWDKLPQDKKLMDAHGDETALLDEIARGLKRQLRDRSWQEGIGIPYAFRWLRDRKWREQGIKPSDPSALDRFTQQEQPQQPRSYHTEILDGEEVVIYDD